MPQRPDYARFLLVVLLAVCAYGLLNLVPAVRELNQNLIQLRFQQAGQGRAGVAETLRYAAKMLEEK